MVSIPQKEPESFVSGDTVKWTKNLADYSPDDGWTLTYVFIRSTDRQTVTATDNGDGIFAVTIAAAASAAFAAEEYLWQGYVELSGERYTIGSGRVVVEQGLQGTAGQAYDPRSTAEKMLEKVEDLLLEDVDGITSIAVDGVSITTDSRAELLTYRAKLKAEVNQEKVERRLAAGLGSGRKVGVRF